MSRSGVPVFFVILFFPKAHGIDEPDDDGNGDDRRAKNGVKDLCPREKEEGEAKRQGVDQGVDEIQKIAKGMRGMIALGSFMKVSHFLLLPFPLYQNISITPKAI